MKVVVFVGVVVFVSRDFKSQFSEFRDKRKDKKEPPTH